MTETIHQEMRRKATQPNPFDTELVTKTCAVCLDPNKVLADFPKYSRHLDGLSDVCRACHKIARDARKTATPADTHHPDDVAAGNLPTDTERAQGGDDELPPFEPLAAKKAKLAKQARDRRAAKKAAKS